MSQLLTILRAAHCRSTHHYFAIDALSHITSPQGKLLANLLLKHHDEYLVGAKAPDSNFKDFKNHVLHISDSCWGGALSACDQWWKQSVELLNEGKWKKAAFAIGVLSHYFTDPIMPLHTGQSEQESVVHRPMEWSVCKTYDEIYQLARQLTWEFELHEEPGWLADGLKKAATMSHTHYDWLIDEYDLAKGCKKPPEGLNTESRKVLAELFALAIGGWAKILERLANETTSPMPEVSLSLTTFLATLDMPMAWIVRKISDTSEKLAVGRILKEFEATGKVQKNLPREARALRKAKEAELAAEMASQLRPAKKPKPTSVSSDDRAHPGNPAVEGDATQTSEAEPSLHWDHDLVDAPSIGPKTAKRFRKIGIDTVRQFLNAEPEELEEQLNARWITVELLQEWQDQARLVCQVPALCGYKSQLLVAVGCRNQASLATENAFDLAKRVEQFSQTLEGKRILRRSRVPNQDDIAEWITSASHAQSRAA